MWINLIFPHTFGHHHQLGAELVLWRVVASHVDQEIPVLNPPSFANRVMLICFPMGKSRGMGMLFYSALYVFCLYCFMLFYSCSLYKQIHGFSISCGERCFGRRDSLPLEPGNESLTCKNPTCVLGSTRVSPFGYIQDCPGL